MHKWIMFVVFTAATLLSVYLLTFGLPDKPKDETAGLPEGMQLLKVQASNDYVFNEKEYHVKAGTTVRLLLQNKSGIHGLAIKDLNVDLQGDKMQQDIKLDKPGTYEMHCSVMCGSGHETMKSVLIVE
ncbi:cupredoxin domain-containing protein [Paenibacillus sp. MMS18-CY102]|uniref:cupredoxin domain-containing protein n=1 Tax=Paenibacillus sp. MMS18-CY102 TaxID=2682849 RepID=UPI001365D7B5|nr:cupredoxin domain-containing protein [Paenibacillus sp. MMS18-CY102]MWC28874.1 cytochrome C oxidase subunit II [Paenibacillus sp. MMS18-CY102]